MIIRDGFPICSDIVEIDINWHSPVNGEVEMIGANTIFKNVNITTAGKIYKEPTFLQYNEADPIQWSDSVPQKIKDAFPGGIQEAIQYSLTELYECDENQYQLGTKVRPKPVEPEPTILDPLIESE
tara:strand:- start:2 stop:379 length:378 start_codon:yes stop_codon:yes gene_type:complete